jgi:hypothetical protein
MRFEKRISLIQRGKRYNVKVLYPEKPPLSSSYMRGHENRLQHVYHQQYYCKSTLGFNTESGFWFVNHLGDLRKMTDDTFTFIEINDKLRALGVTKFVKQSNVIDIGFKGGQTVVFDIDPKKITNTRDNFEKESKRYTFAGQ